MRIGKNARGKFEKSPKHNVLEMITLLTETNHE